MADKRNRPAGNGPEPAAETTAAGQNENMPTDLAELSSIAASLEQITRRIGDMAEQANAQQEETI
jgi:hypothetical protein